MNVKKSNNKKSNNDTNPYQFGIGKELDWSMFEKRDYVMDLKNAPEAVARKIGLEISRALYKGGIADLSESLTNDYLQAISILDQRYPGLAGKLFERALEEVEGVFNKDKETIKEQEKVERRFKKLFNKCREYEGEDGGAPIDLRVKMVRCILRLNNLEKDSGKKLLTTMRLAERRHLFLLREVMLRPMMTREF